MTAREFVRPGSWTWLSTDERPTDGVPHGADGYELSTGLAYRFDATTSLWYPLIAVGAPRAPATPTVGGVNRSAQEFGDGTNELRFLRIAINSIDDIVAAETLKNGYPGVHMLTPIGLPLDVLTDAPITRVDVVAVGDTETGTVAAGKLVTLTSAEADWRTSIIKFEFDAADLVQSLVLSATDRYSAAAAPASAGTFTLFHIEGRSHAE